MKIGRKIYRLREESKISQTELAHQLGISQTTLHNIESEHTKKINFSLMDKVCKIFNKDFSYFTNDQNNISNNHGMISISQTESVLDDILERIKKVIQESKAKDKKIKDLEIEIEKMKNNK